MKAKRNEQEEFKSDEIKLSNDKHIYNIPSHCSNIC